MRKLARNIMFLTKLFLAKVRNTPTYDARGAILSSVGTIPPRATVIENAREDDEQHDPFKLQCQSNREICAVDLSQQDGGWKVRQIHQRGQLYERVPRLGQHVERKHVS